MIDLHNHILFDTDDGPETIEESVRMVECAVEHGFSHLILTPHYFPNGPYLKTVSENQEKFELLKKVVERAGIPAVLELGNEIMNAYSVSERICDGVYKTMGNSCYIMLETPRKGASAQSLLNTVRKLEQMGFHSIFAHPERIDFVQEDPDVLVDFIRRGCLIQLNYLSLTGYYGPASEKCAEELLKRGYVHLTGSDAHQKDAYEFFETADERARDIAGKEAWHTILIKNPKKLVKGEIIPTELKPVSMTVSSFIAKGNLDFIFK